MKNTAMKNFNVHGWLDGDAYDAGKFADLVIRVAAPNASKAEDLGDRRLRKSIGACAVIIAFPA